MGKDRFTEHAQNQLGCEKCNIWQTFLSDQNSAAIIEGLMLVFIAMDTLYTYVVMLPLIGHQKRWIHSVKKMSLSRSFQAHTIPRAMGWPKPLLKLSKHYTRRWKEIQWPFLRLYWVIMICQWDQTSLSWPSI